MHRHTAGVRPLLRCGQPAEQAVPAGKIPSQAVWARTDQQRQLGGSGVFTRRLHTSCMFCRRPLLALETCSTIRFR